MHKQAQKNLQALGSNPYPGRVIIVGMDETGKNLVQLYCIMGRSDKSRNRIFNMNDAGKLWTEAADPRSLSDTDKSLIIYTAMEERDDLYAVSNGVQTDAIIDRRGQIVTSIEGFRKAMFEHTYEHDPSCTPRISAICRLMCAQPPDAEMCIIKKSPWRDDADRHFYFFSKFEKGIGFCITTYDGPGDPLPSFSKDPYPLPINGDLEAVMLRYWHTLNAENKISLAVKFIDIATGKSNLGILNKYQKVA